MRRADFRSLGRWAWASLVAVALLFPERARAGNDDGILLGNDAALTGGAVVSTVNDGSALWYNPAGLALSRKDSVDLGATAFALRRYKMPGLISADGGSGGDASFTELVSIPSALTYVRRVASNVVGGLGLFASEVENYTLRSSLGVPVEQLTGDIKLLLTQQAARYHLSAGLASKLPHGITVGFALFGEHYFQTGLVQASSQYNVGSTVVGSAIDSTFGQDKLFGFHLRVGTTWQATERLRLAASLQSAGGYFYRSYRVTSIASQTIPNADGVFELQAASSDQSKSGLTFGRYSPWRARVGGSFQLPGGSSVSLEGDVQAKLSDDDLEVERHFVWNLRAGARFPVSPTIYLGLGLFTDRGAVRKDEVGAGNIDFYGCTLGGQYESVRWLASGQRATSDAPAERPGLTFSSTVAVRYAYGVGKLAGQRLVAPDFVAEARAVDLGVHEITLHLGSGVYF
jgi:hypothetical protein